MPIVPDEPLELRRQLEEQAHHVDWLAAASSEAAVRGAGAGHRATGRGCQGGRSCRGRSACRGRAAVAEPDVAEPVAVETATTGPDGDPSPPVEVEAETVDSVAMPSVEDTSSGDPEPAPEPREERQEDAIMKRTRLDSVRENLRLTAGVQRVPALRLGPGLPALEAVGELAPQHATLGLATTRRRARTHDAGQSVPHAGRAGADLRQDGPDRLQPGLGHPCRVGGRAGKAAERCAPLPRNRGARDPGGGTGRCAGTALCRV